MKTELQSCEDIIRKALEKGAREAEVYGVEARGVSVEVRGQELEGLEESNISGYGLRVIINGRLGFAYSSSIEKIEDLIIRAIESAGFADPDYDLVLPEPSGFYHNVEIRDASIESLQKGDLINYAIELEKGALQVDPRIKKTRKATVNISVSKKRVVNSLGIDVSYISTSCSAQIMVVAEDGKESQSAWEFEGSRFLKDLSFKDIGARAAKKALSLLGSKRLSSRRAFILFDQWVAGEFLGFLASSFSAEEVLKGKSMLAGKLGCKLFSPLIDITDNALLPGRLGSRPVDGEGVNSRINNLVVEGILQGYLHNTYTAKRLSSKNTANAGRGSYTEPPHVSISNLYISPSEKAKPLSLKELMGAEPEVLYVLDVMGMHTANPVTGEFSVGVSGLWIENGEVKFPVREVMIAGNVIDLFGRLIAVGDDLRFYGPTGSPHLLFRDVDISG
jgi:PmbA protein